MNFSRAIRIIRAQKGLSQQEFSAQTGIDPSLISRIESGERKLSKKNLSLIANSFHIPVDLITFLATENKDQGKIPLKKREELGLNLLRLLVNE